MTQTHQSEITCALQKAMRTTCSLMQRFTDEPARTICAEYMFTVEAAREIGLRNQAPGHPYYILLERDADIFKYECLKPFVFAKDATSPRSKIIRRDPVQVARTGRVDITVYSEPPGQSLYSLLPLCAIEIKGFNPSKPTVMADFQRLCEFLLVAGATGESVLQFAAFAAMYSYKPKKKDPSGTKRQAAVAQLYKRYIKQLTDANRLKELVSTFTISMDSVGRVDDSGDYLELDETTKHHFVGVTVSLTRA